VNPPSAPEGLDAFVGEYVVSEADAAVFVGHVRPRSEGMAFRLAVVAAVQVLTAPRLAWLALPAVAFAALYGLALERFEPLPAPPALGQHRIGIGPHGVWAWGEDRAFAARWAHIHAIVELPEHVLLMWAARHGVLVPKRALADPAATIAAARGWQGPKPYPFPPGLDVDEQPDSLELRFVLGPADDAAYQYHAAMRRHRGAPRIAWLAFPALLLLAWQWPHGLECVAVALAVPVFALLAIALRPPRAAVDLATESVREEFPGMHAPGAQTLTLGPRQIVQRTGNGTWTWSPGAIREIREDEHHFYLATTESSALSVPKRALPAGMTPDAFRAQVDAWRAGSGTLAAEPRMPLVAALVASVEAASTPKLAAVAAGDAFVCALDTGGAVWCWGSNGDGELGGTTTERFERVPARLPLTDVVAIAAARHWAAAVRSDGTVWTWGRDGWGMRTGVPDDTIAGPAPTQVAGLDHVTAIALGELHGCALRDDGTVWCWGYDQDGALGDAARFTAGLPAGAGAAPPSNRGPSPGVSPPGVPVYSPPPTDPRPQKGFAPSPVPGIAHATAISAFGVRTCAIVDGEVWEWGRGAARVQSQWSEVGAAPVVADEIAPKRVDGLAHIVQVAVGAYDLVAVDDAGHAWAAGLLRTWVPRPPMSGPQPAERYPDLADVVEVANGAALVARTRDGTVRVWNADAHQRGDGAIGPAPGTPPLKAVAIAAGRDFVVAVDPAGAVWGWGAGWAGQLGPGTEPIGDSAYWFADKPVRILGP
jgi:hypothetical protein